MGTSRLDAADPVQSPFYATVWVNGKLKGLTPASKPVTGDEVHITGPLLLFSLGDLLPDTTKQALDVKMRSAGYLTPNDLRQRGIHVQFLRSRSEVRMVYHSPKPKTKGDSALPSTMSQGDTLLSELNDTLDLQSPGFFEHIVIPKGTAHDSEVAASHQSPPDSAKAAPRDSAPASAKTASHAPAKVAPHEPAPASAAAASHESAPATAVAAPHEPAPVSAASAPHESVPASVKVASHDSTAKPATSSETYSPTESREDLYRRIFKKSAPKTPDFVEINLNVDGQSWGMVHIKMKHPTGFRVSLDTLLLSLEDKVIPSVMELLRQNADPQRMVSDEGIQAAGLVATLRLDIFELQIAIPSQLYPVQKHMLSGQWQTALPPDYLRPNPLSLYINSRLLERVQDNQISPHADLDPKLADVVLRSVNQNPRQPFSLDFDGAANFRGLVLEGQAIFLEPSRFSDAYLERKEFRFVYDSPESMVRYSAGDLLFPTFGYQGFVNMGGLGASRDFTLQPHLIAYPTKDYEFYLENRSEVKIYINGSLVQTLVLSPGAHDLQGFPLAAGESDVRIEIMDVTGRTQTVQFSFIQESSLLAKGRSAFSYNVGYPSREDLFRRGFDSDNSDVYIWGYGYDRTRLASAFAYQRGLTDLTTAALYSQSLARNGLAGLQMLHAIPVGKIEGDAAISRVDSLGTGYAFKAAYTFIPKRKVGDKNPYSWRAQAEFLSDGFSRIQEAAPVRSDAWIFTGGFDTQLDFMTMNLNAGYTIKRDEHDIYNASLSMRKQFFGALSANLNVNHYFSPQGYSNTTVTATAQYQLSSGKNNISANNRAINNQVTPGATATDSTRRWDNYTDLNWDYNGGSPFPSNPTAALNMSLGPTSNDYGARLGYRGDQGLLTLSARRAEPAAGQGNFIQNYVEVNAQTAFVMVDGSTGFSRPVTNSFVLAEGIKSLHNSGMVINPNDAGYDAASNFMGPAVLPSLAPYMPITLRVNPTDPPVGTAVEKSQFVLCPSYKSGYLISMGSDGDVVATGTLLDTGGKPVTFLMLNAYPDNNPTAAPVTGFTNGAGRFQFPSMVHGKWRLVAGDLGTAYFEIPKKVSGMYQLGDVKITDTK